MNDMPSPSSYFRIGYALGTLTRVFLRALKGPSQAEFVHSIPTATVVAAAFDTRNDWEELSRVPTLARRGVDLNQWFDSNTKPAAPAKRRTRKPAKPKKPLLGSLDELIAPVAPL
ncbi:hypothetical protein H7A76_21930 [Pseudomonas sp. MSSRFD41]|uniref:hypothetical protein n=1 Tax=Pseudomonas TaxID=286 RepID=UPI00163B0958|nr:hypothetical protein [Pseudomonas sp. MSSRFD41]MBC2658108.1 hypothetical protein [Pseudomonas sp. MSSRFD41]